MLGTATLAAFLPAVLGLSALLRTSALAYALVKYVGAAATLQLSVLGGLYALVSLAYLGVVAVFAGRARHLLLEAPRFGRLVRYASGSVLLGFGVALALGERPG